MNLVVDTSVIISVIANEKHKTQLIEKTKEATLIAPSSLHWEIGNAFSAMFKRNRITLKQAIAGLYYYHQIPLRFYDVDLKSTLEVANKLNIYAYDAYFIVCASSLNAALLSLDESLLANAKKIGVKIEKVKL